MGLFSASRPLGPDFQEALSPAYTADDVGGKFFRAGIGKLESSQDAIRRILTPNERMINIAPCVTAGMGYDGLLFLTSERVFQYKGKVRTAIPVADVVDVELNRYGEHILLGVISATAREYEAFSNSPGSDAGLKYWGNVIQMHLSGGRLARHAASLITGEAGRAQKR